MEQILRDRESTDRGPARVAACGEGGVRPRSHDRQRPIAPERSSELAQGTKPKSRPVRCCNSSWAASRTTGSVSSRRPISAGTTWELGRLSPSPIARARTTGAGCWIFRKLRGPRPQPQHGAIASTSTASANNRPIRTTSLPWHVGTRAHHPRTPRPGSPRPEFRRTLVEVSGRDNPNQVGLIGYFAFGRASHRCDRRRSVAAAARSDALLPSLLSDKLQ